MFLRLKTQYQRLSAPQRRAVLFCAVLLGGMLLALATALVNLLLHQAYYPNVTFLFDPRYRFEDFYDVVSFAARGADVYASEGPNYFPFFMLLLSPLQWFPPQAALLLMAGGFTAFYYFLAYKWLPPGKGKSALAAVFTLCSFPLLFLLDRGNVEMLLFAVCALFVWCYKNKRFYPAAGLLALAVNMKLYPAVFLVLFAADKKYKPLLTCLILCAAFMTAGFWLTGGNLDGILHNFSHFSLFYQERPFGLQFSHSLMNLPRIPAFITLQDGTLDSWTEFTRFSGEIALPYAAFMLLLFAFICAYVMFINKEWWKAVLLLTLAETGFPFVSSDYTLVHLAVPALLFFSAPDAPTKRGTFICVTLALLCIPMNWWAQCYYYSYFAMVLNAGGLIRPLLIILLLAALTADFSFAKLKSGIKAYFNR